MRDGHSQVIQEDFRLLRDLLAGLHSLQIAHLSQSDIELEPQQALAQLFDLLAIFDAFSTQLELHLDKVVNRCKNSSFLIVLLLFGELNQCFSVLLGW